MPLSQNGWSAGTKAQCRVHNPKLPGTDITFPGGLREGDVTTVLMYVAQQLHLRVEAAVPGWNWGYHYRPVRGASAVSNHASGTAFDFNAPRHPLSKRGTFSAAQVRTIRAILTEVDGVVRWGGDYRSRADEMHFEINASGAAVARTAARLRQVTHTVNVLSSAPAPAPAPVVGPAAAPDVLKPGDRGERVRAWQQELWRIGIPVGEHDGIFGPGVEGATLDLQRIAPVAADGLVGPATRGTAARVPHYPKAPGPQLPLAGPGGPKGTVEIFQRRMKERGWNIKDDGVYGPRTRDVIRKFQVQVDPRQQVLRHDGIGGPYTWAAAWLRPVT